MRKIRTTDICLSAVLFISSVATQLPGAVVKTEGSSVVISNRVFVLRLEPEDGGRVSSWRRLSDGLEYCYWDESKGHSGLLDDKGEFSAMPYSMKILKNSAEEVRVQLSSGISSLGLQIVKTVSVTDAAESFTADYEYVNRSGQRYRDELMVRQYLLPGCPAGPDMRYFIPGPSGIQEWGYPYPDLQEYFRELSGNWFACMNPKTEKGVVLSVNAGETPMEFYGFMARHNPTMEYLLKLDIPENTSSRIQARFTMLNGLNSVSYVNAGLAASLKPVLTDGKVRFAIRIEPTAEVIEQVESPRAEFRLYRLDGSEKTELPAPSTAMLHAPVWVGETSSGKSGDVEIQPGTHLVETTLFAGSRPAAKFELPFDVGKATSHYVMGKIKEPEKPVIMEHSPEDIRRGYGVHAGGLLPPYRAFSSLELALGKDEKESFEIGIAPVKNLGTVKVSLNPVEAATVRLLQKADGNDGMALFPCNSCPAKPGDDLRFWITLDSSKLQTGCNTLELHVTPEQGDPLVLPVTVTVYPVTKPGPETAELTMWHLLSDQLIYLGEQSLADMQALGLREIKVNFSLRYWKNLASFRRDDEGTLMLEFSRAARKLALARKYGMERISMMYRLSNKKWFEPLGELSDDEYAEVERQGVALLCKEFARLGFQSVEYFWTDEPPTTVGSKEAAELSLLKKTVPSLRITMTVNHMSRRMIEELDPVQDVWYMSPYTADPMLEMKPPSQDDIRIYFPWARIYRVPYSELRGNGWYAAFLNVDCYGVYNYFKPTVRPDKIVFIAPDGKLLATPARLAVEDGFADFAYLRKFTELYEQLSQETSPEAVALSAKCRQFLQVTLPDAIKLKETFRYGNKFRYMPPSERQVFDHLRLEFMPLLTELENFFNKPAAEPAGL